MIVKTTVLIAKRVTRFITHHKNVQIALKILKLVQKYAGENNKSGQIKIIRLL